MKEYSQKEHAECYQPLFNLMHDEHDVILLVSEMEEIVRASDKVKENLNLFFKSLNE